MKSALTLGFAPFGTGRVAPFDQVFEHSVRLDPYRQPAAFEHVDAIVIWGGADISPTIYKHKVSRQTGAYAELSDRDKYEVACIELAIKFNKPIIGVCRGAQLACAMAGGSLIQHVNNHGGDHKITTKDGRCLITSSVHHQMMYPWLIKHDLIAWSTEKRSRTYIGQDDKEIEEMHGGLTMEPEIVYFPEIRALAIQGHPEFMSPDCEFVKYCNELVVEYLLNEEVTC